MSTKDIDLDKATSLAESWRQAANNSRLVRTRGQRREGFVSPTYDIELKTRAEVLDRCARDLLAMFGGG